MGNIFERELFLGGIIGLVAVIIKVMQVQKLSKADAGCLLAVCFIVLQQQRQLQQLPEGGVAKHKSNQQ